MSPDAAETCKSVNTTRPHCFSTGASTGVLNVRYSVALLATVLLGGVVACVSVIHGCDPLFTAGFTSALWMTASRGKSPGPPVLHVKLTVPRKLSNHFANACPLANV